MTNKTIIKPQFLLKVSIEIEKILFKNKLKRQNIKIKEVKKSKDKIF